MRAKGGRPWPLAIPICLVIVLGCASIAHGIVADSHVSLSAKSPLFHGRVTSSRGRICESHRTVVLFKARAGRNVKLGKDRSGRRGRWRLLEPNHVVPGDRVYARVWSKAIRTQGTGFACDWDVSRVITVP